jgi:hypothetical protein
MKRKLIIVAILLAGSLLAVVSLKKHPDPSVTNQLHDLKYYLTELYQQEDLAEFTEFDHFFIADPEMQYLHFNDGSKMKWLFNVKVESPTDWLFASPVKTRIDGVNFVWIINNNLNMAAMHSTRFDSSSN